MPPLNASLLHPPYYLGLLPSRMLSTRDAPPTDTELIPFLKQTSVASNSLVNTCLTLVHN